MFGCTAVAASILGLLFTVSSRRCHLNFLVAEIGSRVHGSITPVLSLRPTSLHVLVAEELFCFYHLLLRWSVGDHQVEKVLPVAVSSAMPQTAPGTINQLTCSRNSAFRRPIRPRFSGGTYFFFFFFFGSSTVPSIPPDSIVSRVDELAGLFGSAQRFRNVTPCIAREELGCSAAYGWSQRHMRTAGEKTDIRISPGHAGQNSPL